MFVVRVEFVNRCTIENIGNVKGIQTDTSINCRKILMKLSYIFKGNKLKIMIGNLNALNIGTSIHVAVIYFCFYQLFVMSFFLLLGWFCLVTHKTFYPRISGLKCDFFIYI